MTQWDRRRWLVGAAAATVSGIFRPTLAGAKPRSKVKARVVVIGGGFGGATAAKYIRQLDPSVAVTLVEPKRSYYTCPFSNAVIGGMLPITALAHRYNNLASHYGIELLHARATRVDPEAKRIGIDSGALVPYDQLIVAPGIELLGNKLEGYDAQTSQIFPHAWQAGYQTALLFRQLQKMRVGGTVAITIPPAPFRCPPGPYERASLMAAYLKRHNPRSKILLLDSNDKFSKQSLFTAAWESEYPGMLEWVPISADGAVRRVDAATHTLHTELDSYRVDVGNVIPRQRAARIARETGLADATGWCPVDPATFRSTLVDDVSVIGDACLAWPMPKSASSANSQAKACALAIVATIDGQVSPNPSLHNTCYSLVAEDYGISVSMIYRVRDGQIVKVPGAGGVSRLKAGAATRQAEANYARAWYASITRDTFG